MSIAMSSALSGNGVSGTGSYDFDAVKLTNKMTESVEKSKIGATERRDEMEVDTVSFSKSLANNPKGNSINNADDLKKQATTDALNSPKISKPPATGAFGITA